MSTATEREATIDDLYRVDGKAELIAGRIIPLMPTGRTPSRVASRIFRSLDDHAEATGQGEAYADNTGFAIPRLTSARQSFSPDASFFLGPFPTNEMRFLVGAPPSPSRSAVRATPAPPPRPLSPPSEPTISRRAPWSSGTSIPSSGSSRTTRSTTRITPPPSPPARPPTPNPPSPAGGWLSIGSSQRWTDKRFGFKFLSSVKLP